MSAETCGKDIHGRDGAVVAKCNLVPWHMGKCAEVCLLVDQKDETTAALVNGRHGRCPTCGQTTGAP